MREMESEMGKASTSSGENHNPSAGKCSWLGTSDTITSIPSAAVLTIFQPQTYKPDIYIQQQHRLSSVQIASVVVIESIAYNKKGELQERDVHIITEFRL